MSKKEFGAMDDCTDRDVRFVRFCSWGIIVLFWVLIMFFSYHQLGGLKDIAEIERKNFLKQLENTESLLDKVHQKILIVESLNPRP